MDPVSIFAIIGATAAVISSFRDGLELYRTWRKKRKEARIAKVVQVEQSLKRNPPEVERHYRQHVAQFGHRFQKGDDISNKSLAEIIERFTRTLRSALKELKGLNYKSVLVASENARFDTLEVMLQLCNRLHITAPIRNMTKARGQSPAKESDSNCSIHTCSPSSSTLSVQVQVHTYTGSDLQAIFDRIPRANPIITVSAPSLVVNHTTRSPPLFSTEIAHVPGSCHCGHSDATLGPVALPQRHREEEIGSPLKKRLDEMDQNFGSNMNSAVAQQHSRRPTTYPSSSTHPFLPKQSSKPSLDKASQPWHSWSPAPSIASSTIPASTRAPSRSLVSDLVYSQPRARSLQEKLNSITPAMMSTKFESSLTPSTYSPLSARSGFSPVSESITSKIHPNAANDLSGQIWQWAETIERDSIGQGPSSVPGGSTAASFDFSDVRRYAGSVRMTGALPTPP